MSKAEIKVFLNHNHKEVKNVIGIDIENKLVIVKYFFQNGNRQKTDAYYYFDDVYFKVFVGEKILTIDSISTKEV